jgi:hypothetical protein
MTKKELINALSQFDDDAVVILSDGNGWSNIDDVKKDGCQIAILLEEYPVFSEN